MCLFGEFWQMEGICKQTKHVIDIGTILQLVVLNTKVIALNWVCKQIKGALPNEYGIHPAKYAMLMTYANSDQPYTVGFERSPRLKGVEND